MISKMKQNGIDPDLAKAAVRAARASPSGLPHYSSLIIDCSRIKSCFSVIKSSKSRITVPFSRNRLSCCDLPRQVA
jgi:hypothetical protein